MMKKIISLILVFTCLLGIGACKTTPVGEKMHSAPVVTPKADAPLLLGAERWRLDEDAVFTLEDFDMYAVDENRMPEAVREFTVTQPITVSGKYPLPPVTNATPLADMVMTINPATVVVGMVHSTLHVTEKRGSTPLYNFWGEQAIGSFFPVSFLRRVAEGTYYTVCKVEGGGYAYFFFDRPSVEVGSTYGQFEWEFATEDMTDVVFSGVVYGEELHGYAEFSQIELGDRFDDLIAVDRSFQFFKDMYGQQYKIVEESMVSYPGWPPVQMIGMAVACVLLEDGILEVVFQYDDADYERIALIEDHEARAEAMRAYTFHMDNFRISRMDYYPDYICEAKGFGMSSSLNIHYNRYILQVDRILSS